MRSSHKAASMRCFKDNRFLHGLCRHQKVLMNCREVLQNCLAADFFKTHPFFCNLDSDLDTVSTFLDNMEQSDEATFSLFMNMLKSYNRAAYHQLEQNLVSIDIFNEDDDDDECYLDDDVGLGERVAMSGRMVREVLRRKVKMKSSDDLFKNNPTACFDKNDSCLTCFVVNSNGYNYQRPWIKHDTTKRRISKNRKTSQEAYMAVVSRDLVFKMISDVPPFVRKPVNCSQIYIIDEKSIYSPVINKSMFFNNVTTTKEQNFGRGNSAKKFQSPKCNSQITRRFIQTPPPLPPKPDSLSPLPTMSFNEKNINFSNQQTIFENQKSYLQQKPGKPKLKHNISQISLPPPIPSRQKAEFMPKPPPASPPTPVNSTLSRKSSSKRSKNSQSSRISQNTTPIFPSHYDTNNVETEDDSEDNLSLNYNIEAENSDGVEEAYEPISPHPLPTKTQLSITPNTSSSDNTQTLCSDFSGNKQMDSNINNNDSEELSNYTHSSIQHNDACNQIERDNSGEIVSVKNTKHDYLILEANDHDLQGGNYNNEIKKEIDDEINCNHESVTVKSEIKSKQKIENNFETTKDKNHTKSGKIAGELNQVFSDYTKILQDLASSELEFKNSDVCVDRSSSKSEPVFVKKTEPTIKPSENQISNQVKTRLNQEIMELTDEHLLINRMSDSSKNSSQAATSVSRSSSGISATVSEKVATRDSGVDSTVSHSLHDSPFCAKDPVENLDTIVLEPVLDGTFDHFDNDNKLSEPSYYEDIDHIHAANLDSMSQSHYLDPRTDFSKENSPNFSTNSNQKVVCAGSLLITDGILAQMENDPYDFKLNSNKNKEFEKSILMFSNTVIGYDKEGLAYYVPVNFIQRHGDPTDQPWFYPIPLTIKEASIFLKQEEQNGCFLLYKYQEEAHIPDGCVYFLGVYSEDREVVHYPIVENIRGDFMIEGDERSFLSVCELVQYYKRNKDRLVTRLRRCLKESRMAITPGYHYPSDFELPKKSICMSSKVFGEGRFGPLCLATLYRQQPVMVRLFQRCSSVEQGDGFLNEALILMKIDHKNIIKLLGVCFKSKPYYIVMETFGSGSLKDVLSYGSLPSDRNEVYYDICLQMTSALVHLENMHFVLHRDISSSSFLISSDNSVKLFNFEKACLVDDNNYEGEYEEEMSVRWAAPEVLIDSHYSTQSDVWALAVVFWELFSHGMQPYHCMSEQQVILTVLEKCKLDKPVDCDNRMYNIILQCWKFKPSSRPSFRMLEDKLKGQSSIYYMNSLKKQTDMLAPLNSFDSLKHNPLLPNKPNKRPSQNSPTTPVIFGSAFQFRNSNLYTDGELKGEDAMKISQIFSKTAKRNTISSRIPPTFVDSSSSVHLSTDNVSRSSKERKSLRKFFRNRKNP